MLTPSAGGLALSRRKALLTLAAAAAAGSPGLSAFANTQAPVRLVVPFTPGTGIDLIARVIGPKLSERF